MPAPTRPVASATIATDWGQAVHDFAFAPVGCRVAGSVTSISGSEARLDLSTVVDDPGGFLVAASDQIEVPADADGLYLYGGVMQIDESSERFRLRMYLNGTAVLAFYHDGDGSTAVVVPLGSELIELAEGDVVHFTGQRTSGSGSGELRVNRFTLLRVGYELGAP